MPCRFSKKLGPTYPSSSLEWHVPERIYSLLNHSLLIIVNILIQNVFRCAKFCSYSVMIRGGFREDDQISEHCEYHFQAILCVSLTGLVYLIQNMALFTTDHASVKCLLSSFVERRQCRNYTSRYPHTDSPWVAFSTDAKLYIVEEGNNLALISLTILPKLSSHLVFISHSEINADTYYERGRIIPGEGLWI